MKMGNPIDLASLPLDIIRQILQMEEHDVNGLRLISRFWNAVVLGFHDTHRSQSSLERVYFVSGKTQHTDDHNYDESVHKWIHRTKEEKEQVRMFAIMPERCLTRLGVGRWLRILDNHSGGAVEVQSAPQRFKLPLSEDKSWIGIVMAIIFLVLTCTTAAVSGLLSALFALLSIPSLFFAYHKHRDYVAKNGRIRARFARFISSFSRIETLVLETLHEGVYNDVVKILGATATDKIELLEADLDQALMERTLKLCRNHSVRQVLLCVFEIGENIDIGNFVIELTRLGVELNVYEMNVHTIHQSRYLNRPRRSWDKMARDLQGNSVLMRMVTTHDPNYVGYPRTVKGHIKFEKMNGQVVQPLNPLTSRGFYWREKEGWSEEGW